MLFVMRTPKIKIVLSALGLILVASLAGVAFVPRHGRPDVSIKLLGYTNDSAGSRLAMITVTNLSAFAIYVYQPIIQIETPTAPRGFTNYFQGSTNQWRQFHSELNRGMSGNLTIQPPPIQSPWRLSFYAYSDLGAAQVIKRFVTGRRYMPFQIQGDWIKAEK
jgi:hypothetical protein